VTDGVTIGQAHAGPLDGDAQTALVHQRKGREGLQRKTPTTAPTSLRHGGTSGVF
jgi:hypothetical protein